jgi:transcriptional regulator GlxA family with amidase domain
MVKGTGLVFVLWGYYCDEAVASIFVTEFRKAGLLVKLVGISGSRTAGAHGLALTPDLMLSEAVTLAHQVGAVVFPCAAQHWRRFANDPTLSDLLHQVQTQQARLIVGADAAVEALASLDLLADQPGAVSVEVYPGGEALIPFAQQLAQDLRQP